MQTKWEKLTTKLVVAMLLPLFLGACNEHASSRDNANALTTTQAQQRLLELGPSLGLYGGVMRVLDTETGQYADYQTTLRITTMIDLVKNPSADAPTDTLQVPKLSGILQFPGVDQSDTSKFRDLRLPLGLNWTANISYGDYNTKTKTLVLPYYVNGYTQGSYGELYGHFDGNQFVGNWVTSAFGKVGEFRLKKLNSSAGDIQP